MSDNKASSSSFQAQSSKKFSAFWRFKNLKSLNKRNENLAIKFVNKLDQDSSLEVNLKLNLNQQNNKNKKYNLTRNKELGDGSYINGCYISDLIQKLINLMRNLTKSKTPFAKEDDFETFCKLVDFLYHYTFKKSQSLNCKANESPNLTKLRDDKMRENKLNDELAKKLDNLIENLRNDLSFSNQLNCESSIEELINLIDTFKKSQSIQHCIQDCTMPDLNKIINLKFFHAELDSRKAEELLADKPEGTFLLRISSHPNHQFSVSFRSHSSRTLHARIEYDKENKKYSFDSKDKDSQKFQSINELFEKYTDSKRYIFEPILNHPLQNSNPHTLTHLAQYAIISITNYHFINQLPLPITIKKDLNSFNYCNH